jgi:hypothetical protein
MLPSRKVLHLDLTEKVDQSLIVSICLIGQTSGVNHYKIDKAKRVTGNLDPDRRFWRKAF